MYNPPKKKSSEPASSTKDARPAIERASPEFPPCTELVQSGGASFPFIDLGTFRFAWSGKRIQKVIPQTSPGGINFIGVRPVDHSWFQLLFLVRALLHGDLLLSGSSLIGQT